MAFIRIKQRGAQQYAYRVTAYYNKDRKKPAQKQEYLGVVTNDGIERKRINSRPKLALDYGNVSVMHNIAKEVGLEKVLRTVYDDEEANTLLSLAINKNARGVALKNFQTWYEATDLSKALPIKDASSQRLSEFLARIGTDDRTMREFFATWLKVLGTKETLLYDITSLGSASELINMLEYGYSRDDDGLPQVNFGLIVDRKRGLPGYYKLFPGSIADVSTYKNMQADLLDFQITGSRLIMDRGFFKPSNVRAMADKGFEFVIAMPFRYKAAKKMLSIKNQKIAQPKNMFMFNGHPQYAIRGRARIEETDLDYYLYLDENRRANEIDRFYRHLTNLENAFKEKKTTNAKWARATFYDLVEGYTKYFTPVNENGLFVLKQKPKAISRAINRMGKMILVFKCDADARTALENYRGRDMVEKMFDTMKNEIDAMPLRVHKEETLRGALLVTFVAAILHFELLIRMRKCKLNEKHSVESLLLELEKIKIIEMLDGSKILSEVTKRCRDILTALKMGDIVPTLPGV